MSTNLQKAIELIENFSDEQLAELYIYLGERPPDMVDPVRLAYCSYNSLKEEELPDFFEKLRASLPPEVWDLLTE